jgi:S1-C subfamily serine protease
VPPPEQCWPAFLGIRLGDTTSTVQGVYPNTPAAEADVEAGDTVTAIDETNVSTSKNLRQAVAAYSPGDRVSVTGTGTNGTSHTATVTLAQGPVQWAGPTLVEVVQALAETLDLG